MVSMVLAIEILVYNEYVMVSMVLGIRDISLQGVCYCLYDFGGMERVSSQLRLTCHHFKKKRNNNPWSAL